MTGIVTRPVDTELEDRLTIAGLPPFLARIYAARGIGSPSQLDADIKRLIPPEQLLIAGKMAAHLADTIAERKKLLIVADYDADGATACAVGLRALRGFGADVDYLVPNRFEYGYGLTPEIVKLAAEEKKPDVLITVDNGIASIDGVAEANRLGMKVLVTDHHLPGQTPQAIVAPEAEAHRIGEGGKGKLACSPQLELPARRQLPEGSELGADGPGLVGNNAEEVELLKLGCRANCTDALQAIKAGVEGQRARRPVVPQAEAGEARAQPALIATTNDDGDAFTT
jgi:hypothetical protein